MKFKNKFNEIEVQKYWDKVSDIYIDFNDKVSDAHDQRFVEAMKHLALKSELKLLNVWSRDGGLIPYLRKKKPDVKLTNYELSPKLCKIAKKIHPNEKFIQGSLLKFPFKDKEFDTIISLETLEHTAEPLTFIKECNRVLKKNGQLIMSLPPAAVEYTSIIADLFNIGHGEGPHKFQSSKNVKKMLKLSGFKLIKHKGTVLVPVGPNFLKNISNWFEKHIQNTFLKEFGIRQFYICKKK
jgi:SAM-dependent methyltransferase